MSNKRINMIKTVIIIALVLLGVYVVVNVQPEQNDNLGVAEHTCPVAVYQVANQLGAESESTAYYREIDATYGAKFKLNGETIEIYSLTPDKIDDAEKVLSASGEVRRYNNVLILFYGDVDVDKAMEKLQ